MQPGGLQTMYLPTPAISREDLYSILLYLCFTNYIQFVKF